VFDVAQSPLKPLRTVTTGVLDANPKPLGKVTSIVSFDVSERPPEADAVKPTVQVVPVAPATIDEPEKVTPDTAVGPARRDDDVRSGRGDGVGVPRGVDREPTRRVRAHAGADASEVTLVLPGVMSPEQPSS